MNPVFLDTIKMMFTWKQINFESRIEQVNKIGNIATWTQEKNNNVSLNTIEEVYELLYQQVIEMKREKNTDNFVTIEQMENMVSQHVSKRYDLTCFSLWKQQRYCITVL